MASGSLGKCALISCSKEILSTDGHVDVRAFPVKEKNGLKIKWTSSGEAVLHIDCWTQVWKALKGDNSSFTLSELEQGLVKEAAKTAEFHNSEETVQQEATRIAEFLKKSKYCIAFTGAGISTAAGIGDFRGKDGKWTNQAKEKSYGATAVKASRGKFTEQLRPTYTHEALVKLVEMDLIKFVISQNTDGLHRLSGIPKSKISELHGNSFIEKCEKCDTRYERAHGCRGRSTAVPPKKCEKCRINHRTGRICDNKKCGGYLMNTIINFGDYLESDILDKATENARQADLVIALGTTLQVSPANSLVEMGKSPTRLVLCNRQVTPYDLECNKLSESGEKLGSRVYGDCDKLMHELMKAVLTKEERQAWEGKQAERMAQYDMQRVKIG